MIRAAFWLGLLLLLAVPLRLLWLASHPPGLFYDPASEALDALEVLAGARPAFLPENNGREPLFVYLMALVFTVTGPTVTGLRLTSALIGIASVLVSYCWARAWFGRRVAMLTSALMAVSLWHVALSRFGTRSILLPLIEPLAALLIWQAARSGHLLTWALAGLALGSGAYTYLSFRLFPLVALGALLAGLVSARAERQAAATSTSASTPATSWGADLRRALPGVTLMVTVATVVIAPLAAYFLAHPEEFGGRVQQVSLAGRNDALAKIRDSALATLGMFVIRGDHFPFFNVPDRPVFDPLVAVFAVIGLGVALRHIRDPRFAILLLWIVVMLVPGFLSVAAPNFQRTAGAMPAVFVLPALGLTATGALLVRWLHQREASRTRTRLLALALCGGVVLISMTLTARAYFVDLLAQPDLWEWYETDVTALGEYARTVPQDTAIYALLRDLPDVARDAQEHTTLTFLSGRDVHVFTKDVFPIADGRHGPVTYLLQNPTDFPWQRLFPSAQPELLTDPFSGRPLLALTIPSGVTWQPERPIGARWETGAELVGAALAVDDAGRPSELTLYWRRLGADTPAGRDGGTARAAGQSAGTSGAAPDPQGQYLVFVIDGEGRNRSIRRVRTRTLACSVVACGAAQVIAQRIYLDPPPSNSPPPYSFRVRMQDEDGDTLRPIDDSGRRLNADVRVGAYP